MCSSAAGAGIHGHVQQNLDHWGMFIIFGLDLQFAALLFMFKNIHYICKNYDAEQIEHVLRHVIQT